MNNTLRIGERIRFGAAEEEAPPAWALPLLALPAAMAKLSDTLAELTQLAEGTTEEAPDKSEEEELRDLLWSEPEPVNETDAAMIAHRRMKEAEHAAYLERQQAVSALVDLVSTPAPVLTFEKRGWRE